MKNNILVQPTKGPSTGTPGNNPGSANMSNYSTQNSIPPDAFPGLSPLKRAILHYITNADRHDEGVNVGVIARAIEHIESDANKIR